MPGTVPVAFPGTFRSKKLSHFVAGYLPRQSVAGLSIFSCQYWLKTSFILTFVRSRSLPVSYARWRNHVTGRLRRNHNSSSRVARTLGVTVTTIIAVSNAVSTTDLRCVPENLPVTSVDRSSWSDSPCGNRGSDRHRSHSDERGQKGHHRGSSRCHESSRARHSPRRHESGERTRPSSSSGTARYRSMHGVDSTAHPWSACALDKATDSRPSSHHRHHRGLQSTTGPCPLHLMLRLTTGPFHEQHHHRRHEKDSPGSTHVSRREIDLTTTVPDQPERRTIIVIQSPARPASEDDSKGVTGPAEAADLATGEDSARLADSAVVADPAEEDDSAVVADPAEDDDSAGGADPAERDDSAAADSARGAGPAGQSAPAVMTPTRSQTPVQQGRDPEFSSEDGSVIFPSLPRLINQTSLLDFLSMMTLMQRRMDTVMPAPENPDRPPVERRVVHRSPSSSRTGELQAPARRSRTPVRRCRDFDESRSSTCSRLPVRKSSSKSPPRDGSPVNFSAALDPGETARSLSDGEDEDGSSRKVSSAQYQLFYQAVTSSKGSFKLNPAMLRRGARASLMDLGNGEVADWVSWLDQPSLKDTMASTARIGKA